MVRATRSTAALQNHQAAAQEAPPPAAAKKPARKRKRSSVAPDDQRATKQRREEVKQEEEGPGAGDQPLEQEDATQILEVLEMIDTQGLLDRVFPLPETEPQSADKASSSKDSIKMYSLRSLLKSPSSHPLRVIRAAIQPLFPISSHPRTKTSLAATQQLHFCNLALSLLDQSSMKHPPINLSDPSFSIESEDQTQPTIGLQDKRRRYALVQRLPGGDWWTSANTAREGEQGLTAAEAKELVKGQAELVSIIPSLPMPPSNLPKLGDLQLEGRRESRHKFKPLHMHPRHVSTGTFLDYGPNTSFAPAFDSEGAEVGREGLGEVLMGRIEKKKIRDLRRKILARIQQEQTEDAADAMDTDQPETKLSPMDEVLNSLFPNQELGSFKEAVQLLQVETDVASLLEKNAKALERLNLLQAVRLRTGGLPVNEDSEEWKLAQEIFNSLTVLAALRPRAASSDGSEMSLVPPASVLRALHSTLPFAPAQGWQGTLEESRKMALRDDTTVHIKSTATHINTQPAAPAPIPTPYAAPAAYAPPNAQYRPPAAYPYHPPVASRPGAQTPTANQSQYYPNAYFQSQPGAQYQYPYPAQYYNYQPQSGQKVPAAPGYYGAYMPVPGATPRAVGNTAKPQQAQQNGWAQAYGQSQQAATLPPHLRRSGTATPGTPAAAPQAYSQYHAYVPPTQPK